jgi:hypothetical protein
VVAQFLVEGLKFHLLSEEFVPFLFEPLAMRSRRSSSDVIIELADARCNFTLEWNDVLGSHS